MDLELAVEDLTESLEVLFRPLEPQAANMPIAKTNSYFFMSLNFADW